MPKQRRGLFNFFTTLLLCPTFLCSPVFAVDEAKQSNSPPLQSCGKDCVCGCQQGAPCTCKHGMPYPKAMQQQPAQSCNAQQYNYKASCGSACCCGCQNGGVCTCQQEANEYYNTGLTTDDYTYGDQFGSSDCCSNDQNCQNECECDQSHNTDWCADSIVLTDSSFNPDPDLLTYETPHQSGVWLPDDPVLFRPFMADPREICYSVGWRFNDDAMTKDIIDVSFGDTFAIYRWFNIGPCNGQVQIELEGAVWAVFDPIDDSSPLINADYYVGIPVTYAFGNWQFRLRGFHISSHIGDEFLLDHPGFDRRNASAEYLDFFISHDITHEIRIYAGLGGVIKQDKEFKTKRFYSALGAELRMLSFGFYSPKDKVYGCPIFAMHFRQNGDFRKHIDATYILGYEFGKVSGLFRKLRFFMEYHDGYSVEGQFCKEPTNYFSVRTSYGF